MFSDQTEYQPSKQNQDSGNSLDPKVVAGCFDRDLHSQRLVYETYYKKMFAVCMRYSGNSDEAKDLLHDGFMKLFDVLSKKPEVQNFDAWIRKLFQNHCLDYVRSAYKKYIVYQAEDYNESEQETTLEEADSNYLQQYNTNQLLSAFAKLRPDYRIVLNLYAVEGLSHQQIAESLGIKEATSRSKLMRARNSLKKILTQNKK